MFVTDNVDSDIYSVIYFFHFILLLVPDFLSCFVVLQFGWERATNIVGNICPWNNQKDGWFDSYKKGLYWIKSTILTWNRPIRTTHVTYKERKHLNTRSFRSISRLQVDICIIESQNFINNVLFSFVWLIHVPSSIDLKDLKRNLALKYIENCDTIPFRSYFDYSRINQRGLYIISILLSFVWLIHVPSSFWRI
jgi:hypothetical protein